MPTSRRDISLTQLTYFVAAAEHGSMTAAAEELLIAQSAISTAITHLEHQLGIQLMIRQRAKGLQLTAAGEDFLQRSRRILAEVDETVAALHSESLTGKVSVGCFRTLAPFFLPTLVRDLGERAPKLHVGITELTADEVAPALAAHRIEVALTYDLGLDATLRLERLAQVPLYAAVAQHHPLAHRESVSLAELAKEPLVLLDLPLSRDYFLRTFTNHGLQPTVRYRFESYEAVRAMVAMGHGFTLLNQQPKIDSTYSGGSLYHIPILEPTRSLDIVLAWNGEGAVPTRRARAFADTCRDVIGGSELAMAADEHL
ncbi:LysR family transcriptional regulator [Brachybacterium endophyticum]|uniref:LysR family transcriptional regulator n=1 Tax=Brachybacterium endophyticum TaxID=2182385 RepID=A0A2U2RNG2_9MICO|nr:LysR family transcriptional regulator [Brachybacterium endophyticum]PWH07412.1 LysR family transcriptional regulator [Brachybacterium endophyticum]